jgi:hypothetical protein
MLRWLSVTTLNWVAHMYNRSFHLFLLSAWVLAWQVGVEPAWSKSAPGNPSASLAELTDQIRIGTDFFLNRTETKETIYKHFRLMREYGITIARIFIFWDDIECKPGEWNFEAYDWIYDAAAENNIKIAATLCSEDPPGWRKMTPFVAATLSAGDQRELARGVVFLAVQQCQKPTPRK